MEALRRQAKEGQESLDDSGGASASVDRPGKIDKGRRVIAGNKRQDGYAQAGPSEIRFI